MSLLRHTSYNLAGYFVPMVVGLLTVPAYLKVIGVERYGMLAICWTMLGFVGFVSLGMGPALARQLAVLREAPAAERSRLFWSANILNIGLATLGGLIVLIGAQFYFRTLATGSGVLQAEAIEAVPWLALAMAVGIAGGVFAGALQGRQRFGSLNLVGIVSSTVVAVTPLVTALIFGPQLKTLIITTLLVSAVSTATLFALCRAAVPLERPTAPRSQDLRHLFVYGSWMSVVSLAAPIVMISDRLVIGSILGSAAVAAYVIPYNLVSKVVLIPASLSNAVLPRMAGASASEEETLINMGLAALLAVITPLCVIGCAIMAPFLTLWVGSSIALQAASVGCILTLGFWAHGIAHIPSTVVLGRGRPDLLSKLLLAYMLPYFSLLYFLLQSFGLKGAAIAWTVRAAFDLTLFYWVRLTFRQSLQIAICAALVSASMIAAISLNWRGSWYWLVMTLLATAAIFLGATLIPRSVVGEIVSLIRGKRSAR